MRALARDWVRLCQHVRTRATNRLPTCSSVGAHALSQLADKNNTGRVKRGILYTGNVETVMNLRDFPFDLCAVQLNIESISHWSTRDGSNYGSLAFGCTYKLRKICEKGERIEAQTGAGRASPIGRPTTHCHCVCVHVACACARVSLLQARLGLAS
jgi:hypothetical protein